MRKEDLGSHAVLAVGILAVSSAAILISLARAEGMPALAIAALRLSFASAALIPFAAARAGREILALGKKEIALACASGACLALHFAFWIRSLDHTSVMSSVVFVSMTPLFAGIATWLMFREPLGKGTIAGIALAVIGSVAVGLADAGVGGGASGRTADMLRGDALALLGAVAVTGYLLLGRVLRKKLSLAAYIGLVYTSAAIVLLAMVLASGTRLDGYSPRAYLLAAALAAGPQLLGHSAFNWALKKVSAVFVTVTLLAEPVGATLLAVALLGQKPSLVKVAGGALILCGIYLAARVNRGEEVADRR